MKNVVILLSVLLAFISCGKKSDLIFIDNTPKPRIQKEELITFEDLKREILVPHCIVCHKKSDTEEGIAKWVKAGDPENSKLFLVVKEGRMPKNSSPLSLSDVEFIRQYIIDLNKFQKLETVNFETLKNEILVPHCLTCHNKMDNEENLQRWVNQEEPLKSRLLQVVIEGRMPKNADNLSQAEQIVIQKYLNNFVKKVQSY